jgi:hypothetical protein
MMGQSSGLPRFRRPGWSRLLISVSLFAVAEWATASCSKSNAAMDAPQCESLPRRRYDVAMVNSLHATYARELVEADDELCLLPL